MTLVIDSNVLVSLLVFDDPRYRAIQAAWRAGRLRVVTDAACAAEFRRVLAYPQLGLDGARQSAIYGEFLAAVALREGAATGAVRPGLPRCADEDDQKFLELAAACSADLLVTGDRELLKLARRVPFSIVTADELERNVRSW